jgi:outer membrane murein-binding lipoprotein Lpp
MTANTPIVTPTPAATVALLSSSESAEPLSGAAVETAMVGITVGAAVGAVVGAISFATTDMTTSAPASLNAAVRSVAKTVESLASEFKSTKSRSPVSASTLRIW